MALAQRTAVFQRDAPGAFPDHLRIAVSIADRRRLRKASTDLCEQLFQSAGFVTALTDHIDKGVGAADDPVWITRFDLCPKPIEATIDRCLDVYKRQV